MSQEPGGRDPGKAPRPVLTPADVLRGLVAELASGAAPDHGRVSLACVQGRRRIEFLELTIAEVRSWPERGLLPENDVRQLADALAAEIAEIDGLIQKVQAVPMPLIPMARLVTPAPAQPPAPAPVVTPVPAPPSPVAGPVAPSAPSAPAVPPAPWYAEEKNLRILANLGILVFNVGLIGFITSAWGSLGDSTKVTILAGYGAMLLVGGLALRLKTGLTVTGTALLALAVLAVPIDFFAVHYYGLTDLSRGAVGLAGSAACWLVTVVIGLLTRERLFFWIAYLAKAAAVCYGCDAAGLEYRHWSGPLLGLFLACLLPAWLRRRRSADGRAEPGFEDLLLAPAESFSLAGATAALVLHLTVWLGAEQLDARTGPVAVLAPLALACAYFMLAAGLTRNWSPLIVAAGLKPVIVLAALRAADVPVEEWPIGLMLLAAVMTSLAAWVAARFDREWTLPHLVTGWLAGGIALLWAGGAYVGSELMPHPAQGMSEIDVLLLTAAWPLLAGGLFALLRGNQTGTILAGLLALLETALLLRRWDSPFEPVPAVFVLLALGLAALGLLARRSGSPRAAQCTALLVIADLAAAIGLACILARAGDFWATGWARWALAGLLGLALLYFGELLVMGRKTAWPALAAVHLAVVAAVRSAGLDWPWIAPALAGGALVSLLLFLRSDRLRAAALGWANAAGLAALGLSLAVCLTRPDDRWLALAAVAGTGLVQLITGWSAAIAPARFAGLLLETVAAGMLAFQLGLPARLLWMAAAALAFVHYVLGELGRERSWKQLAGVASDLAVASAGTAALFSVLLGQADWGVLPVLAVGAMVAAILHAVGYEERKSGGEAPACGSTFAVLWAAGFVAAAGVEVLSAGTRLWPELFLLAAAAAQVHGAVWRRRPASEYAALVMLAAGYLLVLEDLELPRRHLCLFAAAVPLVFHGLAHLARRRGWPCFGRSPFDLATPAAWGVVLLALAFSLAQAPSPDLWREAPLWNAVGAFGLLAALHLALSFEREAPRDWPGAAYFNFAGSALAAAAYLLVLRIFSTGTPYRALWIMAIVPPLVAYGLLLIRAELKGRGWAALAVGLAVSALALWQSLLFPDKPLVAALAFAVAAAIYGVIAAFLKSPWFGAAASAAFTVAFFSMLRRLHVPPDHYVLWLTALAALQSLTGSLSGRGERTRRPAMFVGMLLAAGAVTWIAFRHDVYLDRSGGALDAAIWTTLIASAVFALVALLRRSLAAAYPAAAMLLGSYYLVLHRFEVGYAEPYTVPVAALVLLWAQLVAAPRWGRSAGTAAAVAGLALALAPSLALSIDRTSDRHLGHMLSAFALALAAVVAGMAMRRKAYLVAGVAAFGLEGFIKLVHFKIEHHVSDWVWLLLVGLVIIGFVLYAETRRNARLRSRAEEARARIRRLFQGWE
jgi:hypothetical protein